MKAIRMILSLCLLAASATAGAQSTLDVDKQLDYCHTQVKRALKELQRKDGTCDFTQEPRNILKGDRQKGWNCRPACAPEWCSGFWPGILWMDYAQTGDEQVRRAAEGYTESLRDIAYQPCYDHDIGFVMFCSYGKGFEQNHSAQYRDVILASADSLATLFNPLVGTILSWPREVKPRNWPHNTIMDNMMNLDMMFWAARNGGSSRLYDFAVSHAKTTMQNHFRQDGSCYHVAVYDTISGNFIKGVTHQGYADSSMWARGQSWAIYGYTMVYRYTHNRVFLDFAQKVTDIYLKRLHETSDDLIPLWDMDDPRGTAAPKDASAACVVADALLELQAYVGGEKGERYKEFALQSLAQLSSPRYQSGKKNVAFLQHSTGHHPAGSEIDASIIYADYYYLEALLRAKKLLTTTQSKDTKEVAQLRTKVDPYLQHVQEQSDWLYSRLQMYWSTHATEIYVNGEKFSHTGGERAPYATVKFNGTRGTQTQFNRPKIENIIPYDDDADGNVTFVSRSTGKMEKAHPSQTGCNIASLNRQIITIARDAAKVYAATGEKPYGQMAKDVMVTFLRGLYYRNVPTDINHGQIQTLVGMTTFEVIHEDAVKELTEMYPLLRPLLSKDEVTMVEATFKKWAENIIANGVPHNNWNLLQADFIMRIALVLGDDSQYADGHGRQYFLDSILNRDTIRQWSVGRLLDYGFGQSRFWYESPGYSTMVVGEFCQFANIFDERAGTDLFARYPILLNATRTLPEYLFPNRMIAGFGDTHPNYLGAMAFDNIAAYATRHGNDALKQEITALKQTVAATAPVADIERHTSQMVYAPNVSWLAMRTGMNRQHDLMASLNGSLGNHQHANGISLELYGKGYVLGPDAGIGKYLYSGSDYTDYYSQMPAHNTVVVDGISGYPAMMSSHAFELVSSHPAVSKEQPFSPKLSEQRERMTYATVSFREPETNAQQQRTTAIVKTSAHGGYYVDIFRSRRQDGADKTHDYFYHNLGQAMSITGFNGESLNLQPTQELAFAGGHLNAYSYIYNKVCATTDQNIRATFTTTIEDEKVATALDGQHEITMTLWLKGDSQRTVFQALSPANLEYERMPLQPYKVIDQPVLTFVARQMGEAWNHPFVAVYEPSSDTEPGDIAKVDYFTPQAPNSVGITVTLKDGTQQRIVCTEEGVLTVE